MGLLPPKRQDQGLRKYEFPRGSKQRRGPTEVLPIRFTKLTMERLRQAAEAQGRARGEIVREAVEKWLLRWDLERGMED